MTIRFYLFLGILSCCMPALRAQFTELAALPEPVSNNAVVAARVNGQPYVYSFAGIDGTKIWSGIHLRSWRFDGAADEWTPLPDVPDPNGGKIAAAASCVKGKIYVIGGYHVAANGNEISSKKVHVFDPAANDWLPDAADIPVAIDDQVQAVWRDSLIYVVTGWSNTTNVVNVQVFNPAENQWLTGTPVPNQTGYKVFGASGVIIGDTIYYAGGATLGSNFNASSIFRKGIINPDDPTQITWSDFIKAEARGYRMAVASTGGKAVWLGGSDLTYNFNGIAYNGSGGVPPLDRITVYDPESDSFFQTHGDMPAVMDLRGAGQITEEEVILAGGMMGNQQVTDKVWRIRIDALTGVESHAGEKPFYSFFPNPAREQVTVRVAGHFEIEMYDAHGKLVVYRNGIHEIILPLGQFAEGVYWMDIISGDGMRAVEKLVVKK